MDLISKICLYATYFLSTYNNLLYFTSQLKRQKIGQTDCKIAINLSLTLSNNAKWIALVKTRREMATSASHC